jgi:hypothetical protein
MTAPDPHPPCPACGYGLGRPTTVTVGAPRRTITYACDHCHHRWQISSRQDDALAFLRPTTELDPR